MLKLCTVSSTRFNRLFAEYKGSQSSKSCGFGIATDVFSLSCYGPNVKQNTVNDEAFEFRGWYKNKIFHGSNFF